MPWLIQTRKTTDYSHLPRKCRRVSCTHCYKEACRPQLLCHCCVFLGRKYFNNASSSSHVSDAGVGLTGCNYVHFASTHFVADVLVFPSVAFVPLESGTGYVQGLLN